jgi:hypothetical protein
MPLIGIELAGNPLAIVDQVLIFIESGEGESWPE